MGWAMLRTPPNPEPSTQGSIPHPNTNPKASRLLARLSEKAGEQGSTAKAPKPLTKGAKGVAAFGDHLWDLREQA